jgi:hypothetical protein
MNNLKIQNDKNKGNFKKFFANFLDYRKHKQTKNKNSVHKTLLEPIE